MPSLPPRPEFGEQLTLPRSMWYKLKSSHGCEHYRVMKGRRELPGTHPVSKGKVAQCGPSPRVKLAVPGVYKRVCATCGKVYWFILEQTQEWGVLRMRWIDGEELNEYLAGERGDTADIDLAALEEGMGGPGPE